MHWSGFTSTMPLAYCTIAPGAGQASGLVAVHALVLAHQPGDAAVEVPLVEADQIPVLGMQRRKRLIGARLLGRDRPQVVPLLAGGFTCLATDARGRIDVLGHSRHGPHAREAPPDEIGGAADLG